MSKRSSALARAFAAIALVCGVLVLIFVVAASLDVGDDGGSRGGARGGQGVKERDREGPVPKFYVVQSGDTLISIAHRTGVPVATIQALNPEVDPQILVSGEKLKLR